MKVSLNIATLKTHIHVARVDRNAEAGIFILKGLLNILMSYPIIRYIIQYYLYSYM